MLFSILEVVVLSAHLLAVNVATAAPFVCVWCEWRASRPGNAALRAVGRRLARDCVVLFLIGAALGLAELGWLFWRSDPADLEALRTMPTSRWWFGGLELLMYLGCMLAYWYGYDRWRRRGWQWLLAIAAGTNLGYHFPALFTIVSLVSERPELWGETINFRELLVDRETLARVAHFWFASFAVTGVLAMRPWGARTDERESLSPVDTPRDAQNEMPSEVPADDDQRGTLFGARLALMATALQMPLGIWLLTTLPRASQDLVLGRNLLATGLLVAAVVTSLALMHLLASLALGDVEPRLVRRAALLIVAIVTLMVGTRVSVRHDLRQNSPDVKATHGPRGVLPEPPEPVTLLGGNRGGGRVRS
jgi:hypothetical protein